MTERLPIFELPDAPGQSAPADDIAASSTPVGSPPGSNTRRTGGHQAGHRQRLRTRFLRAGPEAVADYELLELLLFQAKPRGDVKPLAKDLLARFGSVAQVVAATPAEIAQVPGAGPAVAVALKTARAVAVRLLLDEATAAPVLGNWDAVVAYLRAAMAFEKVEQMRLLFLDRKNRLIADEVQQRGTVDHTPVYPREVARRALELGASAMILAHNHPSGDPTPSRADIDMTGQVKAALAAIGVALHDHVVVGRAGRDDRVGPCASFRTLGLL